MSKPEDNGGVLCDVVDRKQVALAHVQDEEKEDRHILFRQNGLVPLKDIIISESISIPLSDDEIDNLAFSFSSTLQRFSVRLHFHTSSHNGQFESDSAGPNSPS